MRVYLLFSATVWFLVFNTWACGSKVPVIGVRKVLLDVPRTVEERPEAIERMRAYVQNLLWQEEALFKSEEGEAGFVATLSVGETASDHNATPGLRMFQWRFDNDLVHQSYKAFAVVPVKGDLHKEIQRASREMFGVVREERRLEYAKPEVWIQAVQHKDVAVARFAMGKIAEARVQEALPELLRVLKESDDEVRLLSAVGALVALKNPKAVNSLIGLVQHKDPSFVLQVVFAIGAIGGRTAEGFLVTMASGHPIAAVQQAAKDALVEMKKPKM